MPAIRAGALSYLLKDIEPDELLAAVRKAARGEAVLHPRAASKLMQALHGKDKEKANLITALSERELEVLQLIAEGLSNASIAERLFISEKTVKSQVSNILGKLHLTARRPPSMLGGRASCLKKNNLNHLSLVHEFRRRQSSHAPREFKSTKPENAEETQTNLQMLIQDSD